MPNIVSQFDFEAYEKSKEKNKNGESTPNTNKENETLEYVGPLD